MTATIHHINETESKTATLPLQDHVKEIVTTYYKNAIEDNMTPENVYEVVMAEVELPLIEATMEYTENNQFQAAKILGINRGTFRKKLKHYGLING
jgi:Fis family transcriptional regulator